MRLLTHNMLTSTVKGVTNGYPLKIEAKKVVIRLVYFNRRFLRNIFHRVQYKVLVEASRSIGYTSLPEVADPSMLQSDGFLRKFHHALLQLQLVEGDLVCPGTGRKFPVSQGVPNMLAP